LKIGQNQRVLFCLRLQVVALRYFIKRLSTRIQPHISEKSYENRPNYNSSKRTASSSLKLALVSNNCQQ